MNISSALGFRPPFTAAQWEELEQQALIFKYMMAGVPVPPELLVLIRRSFDPIPSRFYHHAALGYCSYDGKKLDPEPGRCRRTDGKKWRCSKDAHPDSKYCERHMHRSRSRSRKPVESQSHSQSQSSLSTVTSLTPSGTNGAGSRSVTGSFRNIPPHHHTASGSILQGSSNGVSSGTQLHMDLGSYDMDNKDYRYLYGVKAEGDEHSFFSEASGCAKGLEMDNSSSLESSWSLLPSRASLFPVSKASDNSMMQGSYPQLHQYSFFGCEFGSSNPLKLENQSLRPFFDEWPKTKDLWSDLDEGRLNDTPFSPTQLSISIPMASSDFSTTRDTSPNED